MNIEKMRGEFEAWFKYNYSWFIEKGSPQHGMERFDQELPGYAREIAHHDWLVWQASREAVEIILPKASVYQTNEAASQADYYFDCGQADGLNKAKAAIEAAGLKVKS